MDILDIFWTFYLNHLSPLWGYFFGISEHGQHHLGLLSVRSSAFDPLLGVRSPVGMHGLQSSSNSLLIPIFRCAALAMKRDAARPDGTSVRVIGFDRKLHIGLHILCFLLGINVEVRGLFCRMISIGTSCDGTEGEPFRFRPPLPSS